MSHRLRPQHLAHPAVRHNVWFEGSFRTLVRALRMPLAGLLLLQLLPAGPAQ
ncbi:hypothetical protein [Streptomyces litchfieldiae]|uniref:Uncharacterized protein n=1 Tax=Streptomyces litchfieldiae TaxID=3075543 RepID=A0ABU2MXU5_9ACTN|nr:hypothetical protein [Streptomyces sp. DSM 44938]MDT0346444.1 hypothetical protein [Streptomyces sp. DSM 44938]